MRKEIEKILFYTANSPSSHNTQPWFITLDNDTIFIHADFDRRLVHSDKDDRELYISIGAALQNTLYAIQALGYSYDLKYFPKSDKSLVAEVSVDFSKIGEENPKHLTNMEKRHSNRNIYHDKDIPNEVSDFWKNLVKDLGVTLSLVRDKESKVKLGALVAKATLEAMADPNFRKELSGWVRHNLTKAHDGMPGYSMDMPTVMSFFGPFVLKNFNVGAMQAKKEKKRIETSPIIALISGKNEMQTWVQAGQAYERVVLDATANGIRSATMAAAVEIGDNYKEIMKILGINERPLVMFRLGYTDKIPKSTPKRTFEEILRI